MSDIQHIGGRTPDLTEENVDKLVALFPDVLTEVTDQQTSRPAKPKAAITMTMAVS